MLPHFRTASAQAGDVRFATVDCAAHGPLCQQEGIQNYPSLMLYNQSAGHPRRFHGNADSNELRRFLEDIRNPLVVTLTPSNFKKLVLQG